MTFKDDAEALAYILRHQQVPKAIVAGRKEARELYALIEGDGFAKELIKNIEHIEDSKKALARKKYSRDIKDFYERIMQPISNVFSASGASKKYAIDNEVLMTAFLLKISNLRDNKSIQKYIENTWMPLYHTDPNGVIFMEYKTEEKHGINDIYPTYKSINNIRSYEPKGQLMDVIMFEPKDKIITSEGGAKRTIQLWRIVDDVMDRTFIKNGEDWSLSEELTFEHPFKEVPGIINSDIVKLGVKEFRISPIHKIKELTKEYARDQSIKTLYKFLQGFPIHWRYVTQCQSCQGTGKKGDNSNGNCSDCNGKGFYQKKDVTDMVTLPAPKHKDSPVLAPDIAGFISPDLETWTKYSEELKDLEMLAMETHWGTHKQKQANETATGRYIDTQPVMNKLNKYADVAEWVERQIAEWVGQFVAPGLTSNIASIHYGRRYIIEGPDVILEKYQKAREQGDNNVILDRLYNEYLTAKHGNDPQWLSVELLKSQIEPYLHISLENVNTFFGQKEAQKKALFPVWWKTLDDKAMEKSAEELVKMFEAWILTKADLLPAPTPTEPPTTED